MPRSAPGATPLVRRLFFALLYFSEGAPIGYIWWAMPTRLRAAGMPVDEVAALTALLTLPWALKFLWAPAVDRLRGRRWGYRAWITVAQVAMGLSLLPVGLLPATELVGLATWLLMAHAFAAATQDVAIDALAIATVPHDDRARTSAFMQAGMLVGRAVFGGVALAAEEWIGAGGVVFALIGCIWITLIVVWVFPRSPIEQRARPERGPPLLQIIRRVLARRSTWLGLVIASTAGAGFEAAGGLMGSYLLDRGVTQQTIGWFFALPVVICMIVGGLAGGWAADRVGHRRLVGVSVVAILLSIIAFVLADYLLTVRGLALMALILPLYLCLGSLTTSSYALFMDLTDPAIGGTQFSAYMGATNLCEVWAVALAGSMAASSGYGIALIAVAMIGLVAVLGVAGVGTELRKPDPRAPNASR